MTTWSNRSAVLAYQPTDRFVLPFSLNSLACFFKLLFILTFAFVDFVVVLHALHFPADRAIPQNRYD